MASITWQAMCGIEAQWLASRCILFQLHRIAVASHRIRVSNDQNYIVSTGVYPPRVKIFETSELGMKVERGIDAEVI